MRRVGGDRRLRIVGDEKAATTAVARGNQRHAGECILARRHDHVLQDIRQTRFDRRFIRPLDLDVVGHRSMVRDLTAGGQDLARGLAVRGASGLELLQRLDSRTRHRNLLLAISQIAGKSFDRGAGSREFRRAPGPRGMQPLQPLERLAASRFRRQALLTGPLGLGREVRGFRVGLRQRFGNPAVDRGGVVDYVLQCRRGVPGREHLAASGFDVSFPPIDRALPFPQCPFSLLQPLERRITIDDASTVRLPLRLQLFCERAAACVEGLQRSDPLLQCGSKLRRAALPELDLLLMPLDLDFAGVRRLAKRRGRAVRLCQLQPLALAAGLQRRECGGRAPFAFSRLFQPPRRGLDGALQQTAPAREMNPLPPPQLFAQPAITASLGGLALECAALLLHLEDDVVDARQVLLCGLELQFRRAAPRPVLRDTRRFLEQLPPLRGPGAENLTDSPLLDDRIGLDAEPRVHQEILDVTEPADPPVDEILALSRPVQPPRDLDIAADGRLDEIVVAIVLQAGRVVIRRRRCHRRGRTRARRRPLAVAILRGAAVPGPVAVRSPDPGACRRRPVAAVRQGGRHLGELNANLRCRGRTPGVAPAEDDVLHPLTAQAACALLAQHPGDGVDDVALAATVRTDDGGHAIVERQGGTLREALEAGDFEMIESHQDRRIP